VKAFTKTVQGLSCIRPRPLISALILAVDTSPMQPHYSTAATLTTQFLTKPAFYCVVTVCKMRSAAFSWVSSICDGL